MVLTRTAAGHSGIALIRFVGERVFDWKARRAGRGLAESSGKRRIQVPTLGHASLGGALLTLATASLFRWVTIDFDNDYFMHLAWAAEILRGEWPVRDFVEPGFPLQTLLAFAGLSLGGYQLAWEAAIACGFIAAGAALAFLTCRRMGVPAWLALATTTIAVASYPRMYAYPKAFVYPLAVYALVRYVRRPDRVSLAMVASATALAFLFRHDHGAWIAATAVVTCLIVHRHSPRMAARALLGYACVATVLVSPWLAWVAASGHAGQYVRFLAEESRVLTNRSRLPAGRLSIDRFWPVVAVAPLDYPVVGVRWAPQLSVEERRRSETQYRLEPTGMQADEYRLIDTAQANVQAMLVDPGVEDTRGINRSTLRVPSGSVPWVYWLAQRYLPFVRLRILPDLSTGATAEVWLNWTTFALPWIVLAIAALQVVGPRAGVASGGSTTVIVPSVMLAVITYQTIVRSSPDSRLGDVGPLTAVLLAWLVWQVSRLSGWPGLALTSLSGLLLVTMFGSALAYGRVVPRLGAAGIDGPVNLARRAWGQYARFGGRPLDLFAPVGEPGLPLVSRWLNDCTAPTDRVAVIGFEPQVFFLAERGFAGGLAFYDLAWNSAPGEQALVIERWSRQRVPVVVAMASEWEAFSRDYATIRAFIDNRYQPLQTSAFGGTKVLTILTDRSAPPAGTDPRTRLPCFREPTP